MAFFNVPRDEDITPKARQWLDELKRPRGVESLPQTSRVYARNPRILKARVTVETDGLQTAGALRVLRGGVADRVHARRPRLAVRGRLRCLARLSHQPGVGEPALDGFCAHPAVLPLPDRERLFVKYVLRLATKPSERQPKDFLELPAQGLTPADVQEIAGCAAHAVMNATFTTVANTALGED